MSDRHEWTDPVEEVSYTVSSDLSGLKVLPDLLRAPLAREILRLAARVKELEDFIGDKIEIICHGCGSRFLKKDAEPLMAEPCDGCRRASALEAENAALRAGKFPEVATRIQALAEENMARGAVVAPLLPLFRERFEAWERVQGRGITGSPEFPKTVTLTAEFPVEALRALTKE